MAIGDDFSVNAAGDIRRTGDAHGGASPGYYTVLELHRWLGDLADDASAIGDDLVDITDETPSDRSTDNIVTLLGAYNIDDDAAEYLYDGSIIQASGNTIYDGIVNFGNATHIEIIQNGALIANDFWNNNGGLNADAAAGISHRFLVKVRDAGADIDGRRLLGTSREFGKTYSEFSINGSSRGNNVLALSQLDDLNNQTVEGTVAGWTTITNLNEGYVGIDADGNTTNEFYYSEWDLGSQGINDLYERAKWLTRRGSAETVYGLSGELFRGITHEINIDTPTGTFVEPEAVSWAGGTGQLLAIDSTTAGTKMWIQLLTGTAPVDNDTITGGTSSATAAVNVTVTERTLTQVFIGASTGSAIIGGYGVGVQAADLTASDLLFDLTNTQRTPPNNVTFTVGGLVSGEDRVLVGPESAGSLLESQLTANGAQTAGASTFVVNQAIPADTPASGTVRVFNGNTFDRVEYASYAGSTFTLTGTLPNNVADAANAFISYIDVTAGATTATFTTVYSSDRSLFIRVRDGGVSPIKTFETTGTLGSAGGSTTAIRTADA